MHGNLRNEDVSTLAATDSEAGNRPARDDASVSAMLLHARRRDRAPRITGLLRSYGKMGEAMEGVMKGMKEGMPKMPGE